MSSLNVKKGDSVIVIAGKATDKGKVAKVSGVDPESHRIVVEGVNVQTHHRKPRSAKDPGGKTQVAGPIDVSNVMIYCSKCGKGVRVNNVEKGGKKVRVCHKCGSEFVAVRAKDTKKAEKAAATTEEKKTKKVVKRAKSGEKVVSEK